MILCFEFSSKKAELIMIIIYVTLMDSLMSFLKVAYSQGRPFQLYPNIRGISCSSDFGNPSGHAMIGSNIYLLLGYYLIISDRKTQAAKASWSILIVLWILLIGFDRIYLGEHSYSQVISGWVYSLIFFTLVEGYFPHIIRYFSEISDKVRTRETKSITIAGLFYVLFNILCIVVYEVRKNDDFSREIILLRLKCGDDLEERSTLTHKNFLDSTQISLSFGILLMIKYLSSRPNTGFQPAEWPENIS